MAWVYANGSNWVPLDAVTRTRIEILWQMDADPTWIYSPTFFTNVLIDIGRRRMTLTCGEIEYTIGRQ
jgi:hypothetical protein